MKYGELLNGEDDFSTYIKTTIIDTIGDINNVIRVYNTN